MPPKRASAPAAAAPAAAAAPPPPSEPAGKPGKRAKASSKPDVGDVVASAEVPLPLFKRVNPRRWARPFPARFSFLSSSRAGAGHLFSPSQLSAVARVRWLRLPAFATATSPWRRGANVARGESEWIRQGGKGAKRPRGAATAPAGRRQAVRPCARAFPRRRPRC